MPLILVCGQPSSGKSRRAEQLATYFRGRGRRVHVVGIGGDGDTDATRHLDRRVIYSNATEEKRARGAIMAAVERLISDEAVVIVDWLNYIKGFRYQLFCEAKSCSTQHCLVECGVLKEVARQWNAERDSSVAYPEEIFDDLWTRYEAPNPMNRWDKPHFVLTPEDEAPPFADIEATFDARAVLPNLSTRPAPVTETNYLYELDRITQEIAQAVLEAQKLPGTTSARVPHTDRTISISRPITVSELHRIRRQFLSINKVNVISDISKIGVTFADYLNTVLSTGD